MIRYGNCVWVKIFDDSKIKVKLEKTEGGAWSLEKRVEPIELKKFILCSKFSKSLHLIEILSF